MHRQLLHRTCFNTRWGKASDWNPWAKEQPEGQVAKWDNILWGRELRFLSSQPKQYSAGSCRWRGRKIASHSERARTGSFTRKSKSCFHLVHHRHRAEKERCLHSVPFNDSPALAVGSCIAMLCSEDQSRTARYSIVYNPATPKGNLSRVRKQHSEAAARLKGESFSSSHGPSQNAKGENGHCARVVNHLQSLSTLFPTFLSACWLRI